MDAKNTLIRTVLVFVGILTLPVGAQPAGAPELAWSTYLGGSANDSAYGVATVGSGSVIVAGFTRSTNFEGRINSHHGGEDAYAATVMSDGSISRSVLLGGSGSDQGYDVAVDSAGNALIAGRTKSTNFAAAMNTYRGGTSDAFLAKVTPSGSVSWVLYLGGSDEDWGNGVATDDLGNAFVTGWTRSHNFLGATNQHHGGSDDAFVAKIGPNGSLAWATYVGGNDSDYGQAVTVDDTGSAYVVGLAQSRNLAGAINSYYGGTQDAFVARLSSSGSLAWTRYLGGSSADTADGICLDTAGNVLIAGRADSSNLAGAINSYHGGGDGFAAKLSSDGAHLYWSSYLGGSRSDYAYGISSDSVGNVLLAGEAASTNLDHAANAFKGPEFDGYVAKANSAGAVQWALYLGGSSSDHARDIALDTSGNILVSGTTNSSNLEKPTNAFHGGLDDAFVMKLETTGPPPSGVTIRGTVFNALTNQPLAGVQVEADGRQSQTNLGGEYEITGLPAGQLVVSASREGFAPESVDISVVAGETRIIPFRLSVLVQVANYLPSDQGFRFPNSSWVLDPAIFPIALPGYCVGMTAASRNYWWLGFGVIEDTELPPAHNPQRLYIEWLQLKYLVSTALLSMFENIFELPPVPALRSWHVQTQYGIIRDSISSGLPCPVLVGKKPFGGEKAGHAMLAYKVLEYLNPSSGEIHRDVFVYDSTNPWPPPSCDEKSIPIREGADGIWRMDTYAGYERFIAMPGLGLVPDDLALAHVLHSPATLQVTDPDGLVLDFASSDSPAGCYRVADVDGDARGEHVVFLSWPKDGIYLVRVLPSPGAPPTSTFTLEEYRFGVKTILAKDVQMQHIPGEPYLSIAMLPATIDVDPDTLNVQAGGQHATVYVELPVGYDPSEVDPTVLDVHMPEFGILAEHSPRAVGDYDSDGILDLMVKFDRQQLAEAIAELPEREYVDVKIAGHLVDGTRFEGTDTIRVINRGQTGDTKVGVHRLWSPSCERHFYTIDDVEKEQFLNDLLGGWEYEGIAYYAFADDGEPGLMAVHRFYSGALNTHFYTISDAEKNNLIQNYPHIWTYDGIAFYAFPEGQQPVDASPVYRFWSDSLSYHFYTINENEKDKLIRKYSNVWTYEGVAWYAYDR